MVGRMPPKALGYIAPTTSKAHSLLELKALHPTPQKTGARYLSFRKESRLFNLGRTNRTRWVFLEKNTVEKKGLSIYLLGNSSLAIAEDVPLSLINILAKKGHYAPIQTPI